MNNNKFDKETGTFNLSVAFTDDANDYLKDVDKGKLNSYLGKFFEIVSYILQRATYGQHSLDVKLDLYKSGVTDILITKNNTDAFGSYIWTNGHIEFSIDHIYSPGLMLHELGHYLYGLGDEYRGCRSTRDEPASIMEYSFGNNVRYRKNGQEKEYKVLGGFDHFWDDYQSNDCELILDRDKVNNKNIVTDFCHHTAKGLEHISGTGSEHNKKYEGKSCWKVMMMNKNDGNYTLEDPYEGPDLKPEFQDIRQMVENEIIEKYGQTPVS